MTTTARYTTFREFYPFYLSEHSNRTCRRLHVIGSALVLCMIAVAVVVQKPMVLIAVPVCGYGFAWVGHFFFERNRPATFTHPFYSLMADWVMFWHVMSGRIQF